MTDVQLLSAHELANLPSPDDIQSYELRHWWPRLRATIEADKARIAELEAALKEISSGARQALQIYSDHPSGQWLGKLDTVATYALLKAGEPCK